MRVTLNELMDNLGVGYLLGAYETCPWSYYDDENGVTCSAEISMGPDSNEIEGEIQLMNDNPSEDTPPMEQICRLRAIPASDGQWTVISMDVKGESMDKEVYDWEGKSCEFFQAIVQFLKIEEMPDIDELIATILNRRERGADQHGSGGGKSQKLRGAQLMGIKKGGM